MRGLSAEVAGSLNETLRRAAAHERLVLLCSFQKEESVILDQLLGLAPHVRVVTIDTGVLFDETLATWRAFEDRFGVRVEVQEALGAPPWTGPEHCCGPAKVAALERALATDSPEARRARSRLAERHSWDARLEQLEGWLAPCGR